MKITYDSKRNVAYIFLMDPIQEVETIKLSDEMNVDITAEGKVYGIELLNANEQLKLLNGGKFTFHDESTGKTVELPLNK